MRSKFKWIFTLLLAFAMQASFAQEKTITGVVSDDQGLPMPGVNVVVKGTTTGTSTDLDGKYTIKAKQGQVLEFTFVGMKTFTAVVGTASTINAKLDSQMLETVEIVNEGYSRTRTKRDVSGAINTISSETLQNRPNASFLNSLQGTAPGLTVLSSSGSPGSSKIDTYIRGVGSINAQTEPLVVIDGVPTTASQFRNLNQNDIESVSILKDAGATSVYGNRGANGVIVVTTKRAPSGSSLRVSYDVVTGTNVLPTNTYNMANTSELLRIERNKGVGVGVGGGGSAVNGIGGQGALLTDAEIAQIASQVNTNWRDVFFGTDTYQSHNLSLAFGGKNIGNYTSMSYYQQGGMVPTTDFKRFTLRNNLNGNSANEKFIYNSQVALGFSKRNELNQETNTGVNNNTIQNPLQGALLGLPYAASGQFANGQELYDAIGTDFNGPNDTYVLEDILKNKSMPSFVNDMTASVNMSGTYKINKEFSVTEKVGLEYRGSERVFARAPGNYLALAVAYGNSVPLDSYGNAQYAGFERITNTKDFSFTNIANVSFTKTLGLHKIDAAVYMEYLKSHYRASVQTQQGLNPKTYSPGAGTGYVAFSDTDIANTTSTAGASKATAGSLSYFATASYDYDGKYGVDGVLRRDSSYRFVEDNKWGTFYSISGRWNIDRESFMQNSMFSMLKLRASYGTQGNQNIVAVAYGANPLYAASTDVRQLNSVGAAYNNAGTGIFSGQLANPTLRWEEQTQLNIGVDWRSFGSKNDSFEGTVDVYRKVTDKLYNTQLTSAVNGTYGVNGNVGKLENKGIEVSLKYHFFNTSDFKLTVFANGAYNKNTVKEYNVQDYSGDTNLVVPGYTTGEWYLIPYAGVNQANGNLLFKDINGNLTETPDATADRRATGKSYLPKYQGGFGLNADYKGFYTDVLFSWAAGNWRYDNQLSWAYKNDFIGDDNVSADMLQAWTPENHTNFPSLTASNQALDADSDRYLKDSSFLRLKNISIGYNVPKKFLDKTFISSLKFYLMGENMVTWTKWKGFDPESFTATYVTGYPNPKTVSFGTSLQF